MTVDKWLIRELMMWADNDYPTYQQVQAWAKSYKRKKDRQVFDSVLALKGMEILADQVIRSYRMKNSLGRVNREDKEVLKQNLLERVLSMIDDFGNTEI